MTRKLLALLLTVLLVLTMMFTATAEEAVTIRIAGGWPDCRAIDVVAKLFTEKYPNCQITYEYLQEYYDSLVKRMDGEEAIDVFMTSNIQRDSPVFLNALDLYSRKDLDLSNTFEGLIQNFALRGAEGAGAQLYAIPLGAEMRGLYVNMTLLNSLGIAMPTDQASLLEACQKLKENGYIAFHGNPGAFAQTLLYPWICNIIANADDPDAVRAKIAANEPGMAELFREPFEFLYKLVENGYYDYTRAQSEMNLYTDTTDEAYARDFLNIQLQGEEYVKADDVGRVAFMPSPISLDSVIAKTKDDYHSEIEYKFVLAPVGAEGGYAYMSCAHGIAVNKDAPNLDWAVRFIDFLFQPDNNKVFAETFSVIPNTKEAFSYIHTLFDVPDNHISHLGEVTFDFGFYEAIRASLVDLS